MKKIILIFIIMLGFIAPVMAENTQDKAVLPSEIGQVKSVETFGNINSSRTGEFNQVKQSVELVILTGSHKGEKVLVDNMLMGNPAYDIKLKKGDKVILDVEKSDKGVDFFIADKHRVGALYLLAGIFCVLLIAIGRKKGLLSLVSIGVTLALIFCALTPLILSGFNPILATVCVCVLASILAIYLVGGLNYKSTAAILGTVLSLVIAGFCGGQKPAQRTLLPYYKRSADGAFDQHRSFGRG